MGASRCRDTSWVLDDERIAGPNRPRFRPRPGVQPRRLARDQVVRGGAAELASDARAGGARGREAVAGAGAGRAHRLCFQQRARAGAFEPPAAVDQRFGDRSRCAGAPGRRRRSHARPDGRRPPARAGPDALRLYRARRARVLGAARGGVSRGTQGRGARAGVLQGTRLAAGTLEFVGLAARRPLAEVAGGAAEAGRDFRAERHMGISDFGSMPGDGTQRSRPGGDDRGRDRPVVMRARQAAADEHRDSGRAHRRGRGRLARSAAQAPRAGHSSLLLPPLGVVTRLVALRSVSYLFLRV